MLGALEREHLDEPEQAVLGGDVARLVRRSDQAVHRRDGEEAAVARLSAAPPRRSARAGTGSSAGRRAAHPSAPPGTRRSGPRAGSRRSRRRRRSRRGARERRRPRPDFRPGVARSASNGSPGPSGSGRRSTASTSSPSCSSRAAIARPMPLPAPVTRALRCMGGTLRQAGAWSGGVRTRTGLPSGTACTCAAYVRGSVSRMIWPSSSEVEPADLAAASSAAARRSAARSSLLDVAAPEEDGAVALRPSATAA